VVFNYPTLAECYKTAALDGLNRLDSWQTAVPPAGAPAE
jgi:NAD(P) transhydrogenase